MTNNLILVTGATGYVGGRLLDLLKQKQIGPLRALLRSSNDIEGVQCVRGDVLDKYSLREILKGVHTAFYLIHSMSSTEDFSDLDRKAASNFSQVAADCGVSRIIYLGGLGSNSEELSPHLQSRHEVGQILRNSAHGVQVFEFRASIIIGSGSLSYEMIKALVDRLPFMITPKWVWTKSQPIDIDDVLNYLVQALSIQIQGNQIFEIGGKDKVSYGDIMVEYGHQKGLHRRLIHVPVLSPRLSSLWLGLVTPLYARIGKKLIESALNETTVHDPLAHAVFPIEPISLHDSIKKAIDEGNSGKIRWIDAQAYNNKPKDWSKTTFEKRVFDLREAYVAASPEEAFKVILEIGGERGYYYGNFLWHLRGLLDLLVGGVGLRRGRKNPTTLHAEDVVDFWRVEEVIPNQKLKLEAEMKVPGRAWLEFTVEGNPQKTLIKQQAIFDPVGIWGRLYWAALYPLHHFIFTGMLRGIVKQIEENKKK